MSAPASRTAAGSDHWERIYGTNEAERLSWYRPHLDTSLALIDAADLPSETPVLDVGGGASTLVDDLLDRGFSDVTVLDISPTALRIARRRLGDRADGVRWVAGDVLAASLPPRHFGLWHDRAVFHFLVRERDRRRYLRVLDESLAPGGHVMMATFAPAGPPRCSGLEVRRYAAEDLAAELGPRLSLLEARTEDHRTPSGNSQPFLYTLWRHRSV